MMFKVIRDIDGLRGISEEWRGICAQGGCNRIFQSYDWNRLLWEKYYALKGGLYRLFVIYGKRDGHDECAILPALLTRNGVLQFLGERYSDTLDIVAPDHTADWHVFYKDLVRFIEEQQEVVDISFTKLPADSELLRYLGVYYRKNASSIIQSQNYTYIDVPKSADYAIAFPQLNSKDRSYLRSIVRTHEKFEFKIYSKANGDPYPETEVRALRDWMIEQKLRDKDSLPDGLIEMMGCFYSENRCEVAVFKDHEGFQLLSYRLRDTREQYVIFWVVMHKDPQMTAAADVNYIMSKIQEGAFTFDWGTGAYSYKLGTFRPNIRPLFSFKTKRPTWTNFKHDIRSVLDFYGKTLIKRILRD